jgi:predicted transcriptional regulator
MKVLRLEVDDDTYAALDALAAAEHATKEAVARRMVADGVRVAAVHDPLDDLFGRYDEDPGDIDKIVYGA